MNEERRHDVPRAPSFAPLNSNPLPLPNKISFGPPLNLDSPFNPLNFFLAPLMTGTPGSSYEMSHM